MTPLTGKTALVTGGAGGIGTAICEHLAQAGAAVVVGYGHNRERALELAKRLPGDGHMAARARVDESETLLELAEVLEERFGRLDILVNNAGMTKPIPHEDLDALDDELFDQIFRVNVRGAFAAVRHMKPLLLASGDGVVINISSIAARTGDGSNVAYCASKAAMDSLTRSLARALAPRIRVVSVAPGWVLGEYASRMPQAVLESQTSRTPLGRLATADDVGRAVLAAATLLSFSTGCVIPVDGGRPLL